MANNFREILALERHHRCHYCSEEETKKELP